LAGVSAPDFSGPDTLPQQAACASSAQENSSSALPLDGKGLWSGSECRCRQLGIAPELTFPLDRRLRPLRTEPRIICLDCNERALKKMPHRKARFGVRKPGQG
jgi:hypothetical protein